MVANAAPCLPHPTDDVYALQAPDVHPRSQGRKKRDLSVTIAEADNFGLASMPPPAKRPTVPPPDAPEDTPRSVLLGCLSRNPLRAPHSRAATLHPLFRRVSLRLQGKTPVNDEARLDR